MFLDTITDALHAVRCASVEAVTAIEHSEQLAAMEHLIAAHGHLLTSLVLAELRTTVQATQPTSAGQVQTLIDQVLAAAAQAGLAAA